MAWRVGGAFSVTGSTRGIACEFNPPPSDLPMRHSMKRERRRRRLDTVSFWSTLTTQFAHGQLRFPVFASGLIVIVYGNGPFVPSGWHEMWP